MKIVAALLLLLLPSLAAGFDYSLVLGEDTAVALVDKETGITDIRTIFTDEDVLVSVKEVMWERNDNNSTASSSDTLFWETFVDGKLQDSGSQSLANVGRELPTTIDTGEIKVGARGTRTIAVVLTVDDANITVTKDVRAYASGVSIIPLLVVLILAVTTRMVCCLVLLVVQKPPEILVLALVRTHLVRLVFVGGIFALFGCFRRSMHCDGEHQGRFQGAPPKL